MAGQTKELNELAFHLVKVATGQADEVDRGETRNLAAVELGRRGGLKGGPARARKLSAQRRKEIARKAANKRWEKST